MVHVELQAVDVSVGFEVVGGVGGGAGTRGKAAVYPLARGAVPYILKSNKCKKKLKAVSR